MADMSNSELLLRKMAGEDVDISQLTPTCRFDEICLSIINDTPYDKAPQSIMEMLLLEIKEHGGGGDKPTGTIDINQNGTHNVYKYANANVQVPQGVFPEGSLTITENGTYDVTNYANTNVNVSCGASFTIDDAQYLFYNGARLNIMNDLLDLCNNVTNCHCMFGRCSSLTSLDLSNFDTSNVTDMNSMFYYCSSLTSLDLSNFDTLNVTDMSTMFSNCSSLTSLDLSNFNISGVTTMGSMFAFSSFTSIEIGTDDTTYSSNLKNAYLFYNCSSLDSVTIRGTNVMRISDSNAFTHLKSDCKFYVPDSLVDSYKAATNWSTRASYIFPISEYVEE